MVTTCVVASLMELIDSTIVNVSLKHIAGSLGSSTTDILWVITSYAISNMIIIPLTTMLGERFGRKRYYTFSIIVFTAASFMCGKSSSLTELVLWRFIQGLGGGALLSVSQSVLLDAFPPDKINLASAIYGMGVAMGPAIGPTLGGIITDNLSWNWVFFINIPLGIMAAVSSWFTVPDQEERHIPKSIDWAGIVFLVIGVGSMQYVLEEGNNRNWFEDRSIIIFTVVTVIGLAMFVAREMKTKDPVVNLALLKHKNLSVGVIINFCMFALLLIGIYIYPLMVQINFGWTATMTGLGLVPGAIITSLSMIVCQRLMDRGADPRFLIAAGFLCYFIFAIWFSFQSTSASWMGLFWPLLFRGAAGLYMLPAITMAVKGFTGEDSSQAVSMSNMTRQLGGAVGLALVGNQINNARALSRSVLISNISEYQPVANTAMGHVNAVLQSQGMTPNEALRTGYAIADAEIEKQTYLISYLSSFRMLAIISIVAVFAIFLIDRKTSGIR